MIFRLTVLMLLGSMLVACGGDKRSSVSFPPPGAGNGNGNGNANGNGAAVCATSNSSLYLGENPSGENFQAIACPAISSHMAFDYHELNIEVIDDSHRFIEVYMATDLNSQEEAPELNFDDIQVLAIHLGERPSSNYLVRVTEVVETDDLVSVNYINVSPCESCGADDVMTYPYCFVAIDNTDKEIEFNETEISECWSGALMQDYPTTDRLY